MAAWTSRPGPAERADHADRDEPRGDGRDECEDGASGHRPAERPVAADEARGERSQHEHRLEPFAEDEQAGC